MAVLSDNDGVVYDTVDDALAALEHAHSRRLVHRDIKPENLLVGPDGRVKVTDFGLALALPRGRLFGGATSRSGTPQFAAPEQLVGGQVDFRTDFYSLGAVAYFALLGRPPFEGRTVDAIARGHIQRAGLAKRIKTKPGDLRVDALGKRYDLVLISAICHMLGPQENRDLFRRAFQALAPGGRIAVRDFILNPAKTGPRGAALFSLNMLVGTANGASYSQREYTAWLREAGFTDVNRIRLADPGSQLMLGTRPAR